ncbi:PREDICTED: solute carrier family 2, facilitated glucose transporter member 8-like isoform X2 [Papilio polytes]|uniref:solute carrier family 2, facilitated glucose transporter member 8-like isoform X2 n=1 Tax=Papilio polytes TaxID=76194 RepID=UPI000675CED6|nr:PREDICTED: solute carrier family 2, facilitated glucose transporter member 8-like isoform X2 [Papilio polytes]
MFEYYIRQQVWISLRLYIGQILVGYGLGWTAPIIPKLSDTNTSPLPYELTETETSLIASIIYVGTILGPYVTSYLCNAVGRKPCFILAGVSSLISFLLLAIANNLAMIYVGRILCGLGSGIIFIVNLVYIGEIASTNIRDRRDAARNVLEQLGRRKEYHDYEEMNKNVEEHSALEEWKQLLTVKSNRKALFITLTLGIL